MTKRKQATKDAKAALDVELRAALDEARAAGIAAAREFVKRAEIDSDGFVADTFGRAYLKVGNPSSPFRSALKRLTPRLKLGKAIGGF
jgi:hypothetical protein